MSDELSAFGIRFDDFYTLRVLDPDVASETIDLKDECAGYTQRLQDFRKIIEQFVTIADNFAKEVDKEKMRAIGVQNLLKTITKQRESQQQEIQALILEKNIELERLKVEYQYLHRIEHDQQETINNFYQNQ